MGIVFIIIIFLSLLIKEASELVIHCWFQTCTRIVYVAITSFIHTSLSCFNIHSFERKEEFRMISLVDINHL